MIHLQTDKQKTKDVMCTYVGCENVCRITKFYSAAKAKCGDHGGNTIEIIDGIPNISLKAEAQAMLDRSISVAAEAPRPAPNHRLAKMACPMCEEETFLDVLAVSERGHMCFGCPSCMLTVEIDLGASGLQVRHAPPALIPMIVKYHEILGTKIDSNLKKKYRIYDE